MLRASGATTSVTWHTAHLPGVQLDYYSKITVGRLQAGPGLPRAPASDGQFTPGDLMLVQGRLLHKASVTGGWGSSHPG